MPPGAIIRRQKVTPGRNSIWFRLDLVGDALNTSLIVEYIELQA